VIVLADSPATAMAAGARATPSRIASAEVPPLLGDAWRRLAPRLEAAAWLGAIDSAATAASPDRTLIAVERARGSQFAALQEALRSGDDLPDDLACIALEGDGFRGQRGRSWSALRGNLHVCLLARVDLSAAAAQAALTALPAVATVRAIERASGGRVRPGIKWVNDVVLAGHKVGGVLSATHVTNARVSHALVGIGVNVHQAPQVARDPRVAPAGSLDGLAGDAAPALTALTLALLGELDRAVAELRAGDGGALVEAYRRRSLVVGRRVAVWPVTDAEHAGEPRWTGTVRALRDDLSLEFLDSEVVVSSGRLTFLD
jgi:biotin-(acetyl-CoA carboxylase) ligase